MMTSSWRQSIILLSKSRAFFLLENNSAYEKKTSHPEMHVVSFLFLTNLITPWITDMQVCN